MLEKIEIENFRSVEKQQVALAPLTVMFGPTAAGKSSLLYALYVLRNFALNPNQALDAFFNLGFQSLGGFEACIFNHDTNRKMMLAVATRGDERSGRFGVSLGKSNAEVRLDLIAKPSTSVPKISLKADVAVPYPMNQSVSENCDFKGNFFTVNWNGITASVVPRIARPESPQQAQELAVMLNSPVEALKRVDFAPHRRGFFKPSYTPVPVTPTPTTDDEVATLIINDVNLPARISLDTEEIFGRDFRTFVPPGTATFYFQTTQKKARTPVYLVNDGFGVNQVVYILAKTHRADVATLLIEEPEIHLHPTVIRNLIRTLCRIVQEDKKQFVFTTHSEQFLISLLTCVAEGIIDPADVKCYHVTQERRATVFQEQHVTREGQLEGGLASFIEAETQDLKKFLSIAQ